MNCKVNVKLLPLKALNFCFYAGLACYAPYKPIFQKQLGLSSAQNGLIQAVYQIVGIVTQPVSGAIADKTKSIKLVMIVCMILSTAFIFPMIFVPPVKLQNAFLEMQCCNDTTRLICVDILDTGMRCNFSEHPKKEETENTVCSILNNNSQIAKRNYASSFLCMQTTNISLTKSCKTETFLNTSCQLNSENKTEVYDITFGLMLLLTIATSIFLAPVPALIDATGLQALGKDKINKYGFQRLWGAVGYGFTALVAGLITDVISKNEDRKTSDKNFLFTFVCSSVLFLLTAAVCFKVNVASPGAKRTLFGLMPLFKRTKVVFFFIIVYFSGCAIGLQSSFLFWYVVTLPGSSQTILGLALVANVVTEIPLFLAFEKLAKKTSYNCLLSFGFFCYGIRFIGYSLITDAWQVIIFETLHGPSFALSISALNAQAAILSPKGVVATTVGVTQSIYRGFGFTTGALLGGVAYNYYGPKSTFRGMAIICVVVSILYTAAVKAEANLNPKNQQENAKEKIQFLSQTSKTVEPSQKEMSSKGG